MRFHLVCSSEYLSGCVTDPDISRRIQEQLHHSKFGFVKNWLKERMDNSPMNLLDQLRRGLASRKAKAESEQDGGFATF